MQRSYLIPIFLAIISIGVSGLFLYSASNRNLSDLENALFQIFALSAGVASSYLFGRLSAKNAAIEILKPHSRSAFRRLVSLYRSLGRLTQLIGNRDGRDGHADPSATLDLIEAIVVEQISYADDAMEDWRDVVPDEVDLLLKRMKEKESI